MWEFKSSGGHLTAAVVWYVVHMNTYGCWVSGCATHSEYQIHCPHVNYAPDVVEACGAHLGDLLGNVARMGLAELGSNLHPIRHTTNLTVTRLD